MIYAIYNEIEDKDVFIGNENEFILFMRKVVEENGDEEEYPIRTFGGAVEYLDIYCDNLVMRK